MTFGQYIRTGGGTALAALIFLALCTTHSGAQAPADKASARMVVVQDQDVRGSVFKRLGLPNRDYCWSQCLQEDRCTGVRWGVIAGDTAGQCVLISGELTFSKLPDLKTDDGKKIVVTAAKKAAAK